MREGLDLLITCDTGISEMESLGYAASQGLDVILTDHHTPPEELPPALALLNPRLLPEDNPMQDMAGVGTAYQLIRALYETQGHSSRCRRSFFDLVALGTVADLADLRRENRYYVQRGLELMRSDPRPALEALLASADYRGGGINESLIGFTIGPRMNAAGRLDDANIVNVEFLLSRDETFLQGVAANWKTSTASANWPWKASTNPPATCCRRTPPWGITPPWCWPEPRLGARRGRHRRQPPGRGFQQTRHPAQPGGRHRRRVGALGGGHQHHSRHPREWLAPAFLRRPPHGCRPVLIHRPTASLSARPYPNPSQQTFAEACLPKSNCRSTPTCRCPT